MSLINRLAISNFMNVNGKGSHLPWEPRFRYEILNFFGQSTAINATNGCGKTSLVRAIIALLSRNRTLIQSTHKRMSPSSSGIPTHIQIEFVSPSNNYVGQSDMFINQGGEIEGEKWVFGVSGFRLGDRNDELDYYFYAGSLEDCPPAIISEKNKVTLLTPSDFEEYRNRLKKFWWRPKKDEWQRFMGQHVSLKAMDKMAQFQKKGSSDKGVDLFSFKIPHGESLDEAFFYEVIAPEILSGAMDTFDDSDEDQIESVIFNTVSSAIRAKKKAEQKRKEINELKEALGYVEDASDCGKQAEESKLAYESSLGKITGTASFLRSLTLEKPFIGIPSQDLPEGITGEVARHIVVELGKSEFYVLASGLGHLLDEKPKRIREIAERKQIQGRKIPKNLENTCDLLSNEVTGVGQKPISYTLKQGHQIIDVSQNGLDKPTAHCVLNDAFKWYSSKGDGNPYRKEFIELEWLQKSLKAEIKGINDEVHDIECTIAQLQDSQIMMSANEGAYEKLCQSTLFTTDELGSLKSTQKQLSIQWQTAQREKAEFEAKKSKLSAWLEDWVKFKKEFGDNESPYQIESIKTEEKNTHDGLIIRINETLVSLNTELGSVTKSLHQDELKQVGFNSDSKRFKALIPAWENFEELFGSVDPDGLESKLLAEQKDYEAQVSELTNKADRLKSLITSIKQFYEKFGEKISPDEQIELLNKEREIITIKKSEIAIELSSLSRKRNELDKEQVAAGEAAALARTILEDEEIEYEPLYKVIKSLNLGSKRTEKVLISLSSLLFSPVFQSMETGTKVATLLAERNIPVPVISHKALKCFCDNKESSLDNTIFIGLVTRAVQCLLDPELVEREKENLDQQISTLSSDQEANNDRLIKIGTESPLVSLIKEAAQGVSENAESNFAEVIEKIRLYESKLLHLLPKISNQAISSIHSACDMKRLGGITSYKELKQNLMLINQKIENHKIQIEKLNGENGSISEQSSLLQNEEEKGRYIFPYNMHLIIQNAKKYVDNDGVIFEKSEEQEKYRIEEKFKSAEKRQSYKEWFNAARTYLDAKESNKEKTVQDEIRILREQFSEATKELKKLKDELQKNSDNSPIVEKMITRVDNLAYEIIQRFKKVMLFRKNIKFDKSKLSNDQETAIKASEQIAIYQINNPDTRIIEKLVLQVLDEVSSIDIDDEIIGLRKIKNTFMSSKQQLYESIEAAVLQKGLARAEQEILSSVKTTNDIDKVFSIATKLKEVYEKEESELSLKEAREKESRETISGRLNYFIQRGSSNLTLFKQLARKNYGDMKANFIIEANIISEDASEKLVSEIIDMFEEKESSRLRLKEKGSTLLSDEAYRKSFEEDIRTTLYRRVFTNASIYFEMEVIRAKGKHLMDDELSAGEKSAMSLMWAIRLADYAVEKEARNKRGISSQNKARSLSENILILDGLFSDLSATNLIKGSMAGIERTRGKFQLIGLTHDKHYENDFSIFPNLLLGKLNQSINDTGGWVSFDNKDQSDLSIGFAQLQNIPLTENADVL